MCKNSPAAGLLNARLNALEQIVRSEWGRRRGTVPGVLDRLTGAERRLAALSAEIATFKAVLVRQDDRLRETEAEVSWLANRLRDVETSQDRQAHRC